MEPIQEALKEFKIPNSWWPVPLVNAIQQADIDLAIPWLANCIRDTILHENHSHATWVTDRIDLAVATTSPDIIQKMLEEYDHDLADCRGDNLLLSYRNLLQAKEFLFHNDTAGFRTQIIWLLLHLGDCNYSRHTNIRFVIESFSKTLPDSPGR